MIPTVEPSLVRARERLAVHPVYAAVRDVEGLRTFMESHVVCVLDFMTLLKRLQSLFTGTALPWTAPARPELARFVNEIVLDEESDAAAGEEPCSHFEWYVEAMDEIGADPAPILRLAEDWRRGVDPVAALERSDLPSAAVEFSKVTLELAAGPAHVVAAAFVLGREDVIPMMFRPLVRELAERGFSCGRLLGYLERHIEVDSGTHGPLGERLLEVVIGDDPVRRAEAERAALRSLEARSALWSAVSTKLSQRGTVTART